MLNAEYCEDIVAYLRQITKQPLIVCFITTATTRELLYHWVFAKLNYQVVIKGKRCLFTQMFGTLRITFSQVVYSDGILFVIYDLDQKVAKLKKLALG